MMAAAPKTAGTMLATHFGLLEGYISEVQGWANALVCMGSSPAMIEPDAVQVIGYALNSLAGTLEGHWKDAKESDKVPTTVPYRG